MIPVVVGSNPIIHPSFKPGFRYKQVQGPLAQLVEQLTLNQLVEGSNPSRPTNKNKRLQKCRCFFLAFFGLTVKPSRKIHPVLWSFS